MRDVVRKFLELKNSEGKTEDDSMNTLKSGKEELLSIKRDLCETAKEQAKLYDVMRKRVHQQEELMVAEVHPNR